MELSRRGADGQRHRAEGQSHGTESEPARRRPTARERQRIPARILRLTEQPGVHPPVDFFADALDQALGHGCVVAWAEGMVRGRRGLDFIPDAHSLSPAHFRGPTHLPLPLHWRRLPSSLVLCPRSPPGPHPPPHPPSLAPPSLVARASLLSPGSAAPLCSHMPPRYRQRAPMTLGITPRSRLLLPPGTNVAIPFGICT